jgi:hypothetical protein
MYFWLNDQMAPSGVNELTFTSFANILGYFLFIYSLTTISHILMLTNEAKRRQELTVDEYLALFNEMKLSKQLKMSVTTYFFVILGL